MKIDLSTVVLVILCVIPGLFAQRSRNLVCPRSFDEQGSSAELGELVALGISTHGVLILLGAVFLFFLGVCHGFKPATYFREVDVWPVRAWASDHVTEALLSAVLYVFASFALSHWLGIIYGIWRFRSPVTQRVLGRAKLERFGVQGLLGERPIVYEAFSPSKKNADGTPHLVFVEIELKGGLGFYAGQLSQFAILRDDEPHKPVYLISAFFKAQRDATYEPVEADGVLIDLADAVLVRVKQTPSS